MDAHKMSRCGRT